LRAGGPHLVRSQLNFNCPIDIEPSDFAAYDLNSQRKPTPPTLFIPSVTFSLYVYSLLECTRNQLTKFISIVIPSNYQHLACIMKLAPPLYIRSNTTLAFSWDPDLQGESCQSRDIQVTLNCYILGTRASASLAWNVGDPMKVDTGRASWNASDLVEQVKVVPSIPCVIGAKCL
jgi:hypothetical protein